MTRRILEAIDAILQRPGPSPVIVIHGDHGPGSMWNQNDVFKPSAQITPVNAWRVMENRYLVTSLPALPDASFASNWKRPYDWIRVEAH